MMPAGPVLPGRKGFSILSRILAAAASLAATAAFATLPDYQAIEIFAGTGPSSANDVNNSGVVVGCYATASPSMPGPPSPPTAYRWQNGMRTDIAPGCANRIGDSGLVAGDDANGNTVFWTTSGGTIPLGFNATITGINAQDIVSGYRLETLPDQTQVAHGFIWQNGQTTALPDGCGFAINNNTQVLCVNGIWRNGTVTAIPPAANGDTLGPHGLTDAGDTFGSLGRGWGWYDGTTGVTQSMIRGFTDQTPVDLNGSHIFLGDGEGIYGFVVDLEGNQEILTRGGFAKIVGRSINESSWIAGTAQQGPHSIGYPAAVLLVPKAALGAPGTPRAGLPVMKHTRGDFSADGHADLLWFGTNGDYGAWLMDGTRMIDAGALGVPSGAQARFRGDFDGDHRDDLVFTDVGGNPWLMVMNGTRASSAKLVDGGSGWTVIGAGDFDGDGKSDLLWYHPSNGFAVWLMNGATAKAYGSIAYPANGYPAAIGDFDGDGRDDLLFIADDGHLELYTMNGTTATPSGTVRPAGSGFVPAFVANFNGDGRDDIVWMHADGRYSLWLMNGAGTVDSAALLDAGSGWAVIGTPDFDGDGRADLLFGGPNHSVAGWLMSGITATAYRQLLPPDTPWDVANYGDFDGDGRDDLWWSTTTGASGIWLMNGLDAKAYQGYATANSGWFPSRK